MDVEYKQGTQQTRSWTEQVPVERPSAEALLVVGHPLSEYSHFRLNTSCFSLLNGLHLILDLHNIA